MDRTQRIEVNVMTDERSNVDMAALKTVTMDHLSRSAQIAYGVLDQDLMDQAWGPTSDSSHGPNAMESPDLYI